MCMEENLWDMCCSLLQADVFLPPNQECPNTKGKHVNDSRLNLAGTQL